MVQFLRSYSIELTLMGLLLAAVLFFGYLGYGLLGPQFAVKEFSGDEAYAFVEQQLANGPRVTGSPASDMMVDWLTPLLRAQGWRVVIQPYDVTVPALPLSVTASITATDAMSATGTSTTSDTTSDAATPGLPSSLSDMVTLRARNVVAMRGPLMREDADADAATLPPVLVVAPYDSRLAANDADPPAPSPGANVGASGAATLLELAHTLNVDLSNRTICLVFLDGEANRGLPGWQPPYGSHLFIQELTDGDDDFIECANPQAAVVLDTVGGVNHRIALDPASDPALSNALWTTAAGLDFGAQFVDEIGPAMPGAHNTLIEAGIPTVAIIEQAYPYRHTTQDTLDKIDPAGLAGVGYALQVWLENGATAGVRDSQ